MCVDKILNDCVSSPPPSSVQKAFAMYVGGLRGRGAPRVASAAAGHSRVSPMLHVLALCLSLAVLFGCMGKGQDAAVMPLSRDASPANAALPTVCGRWLDARTWVPCRGDASREEAMATTWRDFIALEYARLQTQQRDTETGAGRSSRAVRLLFVGDSQTRYLYAAVARELVRTGAGELVPSGLLPPDPTTRFAFAWLSHMWPPSGHEDTAKVFLGFVSTEYFSGSVAETQLAEAFGPTHIVVGRGCWDMVRRMPHSHSTLYRELSRGLARWRARWPDAQIIMYVFPFVFPPNSSSSAQAAVAPAPRDGGRPQDSTPPLTTCVFKNHQASYRVAVHDAVTAANSMLLQDDVLNHHEGHVSSSSSSSEGGNRSRGCISAFDVHAMTRDFPQRPVDGLHYDGEVGQQIAKALAHHLHQFAGGTATSCRQDNGYSGGGISTERLLAPVYVHEQCASEALPYYNYVVENVISKELEALGRILDAPSSAHRLSSKVAPRRLVASFAACAHIIGLASRYFGPSYLWNSSASLLKTGHRSGRGAHKWLRDGLVEILDELHLMREYCDGVVDQFVRQAIANDTTIVVGGVGGGSAEKFFDELLALPESQELGWINCRMVLLRLWQLGDAKLLQAGGIAFGQVPRCLNMPFGRLP